jgi:thioredoxin-dependent peroxiredoxin
MPRDVQLGYHSPVEDHLMHMKAWLKIAMGAALSLVTTTAMAQTPAAELKVGDMAPAFSAPGSDGKTHTLAESRGKQAVVLAWFPKAFTGG